MANGSPLLFDDPTTGENGGARGETKAARLIRNMPSSPQCRGFGEGRENFLNECHVCTILLSEARHCQLAAESAHLHCHGDGGGAGGGGGSRASWHGKPGG